MHIKILGPGCRKCAKLLQHTEAAINELGIDAEIEKVTDLRDIMAFGIMLTPGLVVDGKVAISGKVPSVEELKTLLHRSAS